MVYKITNKILSWIPQEELDHQTLAQLYNIAKLPFIYRHIAVMPDAHLGKGACVGSCVPTQGAIVPNIVGVDIGCGMIAVETNLTSTDMEKVDLEELHEAISNEVPLSAGKYNQKLSKGSRQRISNLESEAGNRLKFYNKTDKNWRIQLGSLGSGNHFIEVVLDEREIVWLFLHSGSRGIGNRLARHHADIAKSLMQKFHIGLPDRELAYLPENTPEFDDYIRDLNWAQLFAKLNREEMMDRVYDALEKRSPTRCKQIQRIQCHHNFTRRENHFGQNVWVTRKGAIAARVGDYGLIPGSMGTASYVVVGKGHPGSFNTAPHGAGRRFSRSQARKTFTMEDFDRDMQGVVVKRSSAFLDELPGAYKDIDHVMELSSDLVEIVHKFRQIINVKGN